MTDAAQTERFDVVNGRQVTLLVAPLIFLALSSVAVAARWYARSMKRINSPIEDLLCLAALATSLIVVGITYSMVFLAGAGLTEAQIKADPTKDFESVERWWLKLQFALDICWATSVSAIQFAFLKYYVRLYDTRTLLRNICYFLMGIVVIWYLWTVIGWITVCHPPGHCELQSKKSCIIIGFLHVFLNSTILFAPIPAVIAANLSSKRKWSSLGLFLLGCFCLVLAILRIDCVIDVFGDVTKDKIGPSWFRVCFTPIEIAVAIICCCIPNVQALPKWRRDRRHLPTEGTGLRRLKFRSSSSGSSTSNLNPANWMPNGKGQVNAFVSLEDGAKSDERVKTLGPHDIKVTKQYNVAV